MLITIADAVEFFDLHKPMIKAIYCYSTAPRTKSDDAHNLLVRLVATFCDLCEAMAC